MDQSLDKKKETKDKIILFYQNNKLKIYFTIIFLLSSIAILAFLETKKIKSNNLISEKYVQAGLYLSTNQNEKAKNFYEEIILSKNKFYSVLALNVIIEKELIKDKNKILGYFEILEKNNYSKDKLDLIKFKKGLYLLKSNDIQSGNNILEKLVEDKSILEKTVKEIFQ